MALTNFQDTNKNFQLMQSDWASKLNPVLANPLVNGIILQSVSLVSGANTINHKLGRKLQGWIPVRVRSAATFFDTQDSNPMPALTLTLTASAAVVVDLYVF